MAPAFAVGAGAAADVRYIGAAVLPGDIPDKSGLTDILAPRMPHNLVGSFGSALTYTGTGDIYLGASDRGPQDGALPFRTRFHELRIVVDPSAKADPVRVTVERTSLLTNEQGEPCIGAASAIDAADQAKAPRLDPEGIAVSPWGTVWTSDEYGPWIDEWTPEGKHLRRVSPPVKFRISRPAATTKGEMRPHNMSGRQSNRGLEGMCFSPDGTKLYAIMQGPLIQDGGVDEDNQRIGTNVRMLEVAIDATGNPGATRELLYRLDDETFGVNELMAVGEGSFLVIEKDGHPGEKAKVRRIYRIEIAGATDISSIARLPSRGVPAGVTPVKKTLVFDMLDPRFGLAGSSMPEKVEALAMGPDLPDGRKLLLVASDNDYRPDAPSFVWAFSLDASDLPGFTRQKVDNAWGAAAATPR